MIDILLPVYNGESFLIEQIESIQNQTYKNFNIIIRNDGSTDNSQQIIDDLSKQYENIHVIKDNLGNLGLSKTLEILINSSSSDYFMFCDQDDNWKENKIQISLKEMKELETLYSNHPLLICTDSTCVDERKNVIAPSFFESQKYIDTTNNTIQLAAMNVIQGNTCLMNKACKQYIIPFPKLVLYDHWAGIMISHYGKIKYVHQQTLWYRQHRGNVLGANQVGFKYFAKKVYHLKKQFNLYYSLIRHIPFSFNVFKWMFYKVYFSVRRF